MPLFLLICWAEIAAEKWGEKFYFTLCVHMYVYNVARVRWKRQRSGRGSCSNEKSSKFTKQTPRYICKSIDNLINCDKALSKKFDYRIVPWIYIHHSTALWNDWNDQYVCSSMLWDSLLYVVSANKPKIKFDKILATYVFGMRFCVSFLNHCRNGVKKSK